MGGYLTKKDQIHHGRLEMFMHEVSQSPRSPHDAIDTQAAALPLRR